MHFCCWKIWFIVCNPHNKNICMLICIYLHTSGHLIWKNKQLCRGCRHSFLGIGNYCSLELLSCFLSFAVTVAGTQICLLQSFSWVELQHALLWQLSLLSLCACLCLGTWSATTCLSTFAQSVIAYKTNCCSYISLLRNTLSLNPNLYPEYN